jgi:DNA-directed RNA polymerase specialized sigma24 family protein
MGPVPRQVADEEDVALSVMDYLCRGAQQGRFDQISDRDELWRLLFTITAHKIVEKTRHAARQKRGGGQIRNEASLCQDGDGKIDAIASDEPTPELLVEMDDEYRHLMEMLDEPSLQKAASLRLQSWTNEEIADRLGITRRSVERKLNRVRLIWSAELAIVDHPAKQSDARHDDE